MFDSCKRLCAYFQGPLLVVDLKTSIGERAQETGKEKCELILAQTLAPLVTSLFFFCLYPIFVFPFPMLVVRYPFVVAVISTLSSLHFLKFLND